MLKHSADPVTAMVLRAQQEAVVDSRFQLPTAADPQPANLPTEIHHSPFNKRQVLFRGRRARLGRTDPSRGGGEGQLPRHRRLRRLRGGRRDPDRRPDAGRRRPCAPLRIAARGERGGRAASAVGRAGDHRIHRRPRRDPARAPAWESGRCDGAVALAVSAATGARGDPRALFCLIGGLCYNARVEMIHPVNVGRLPTQPFRPGEHWTQIATDSHRLRPSGRLYLALDGKNLCKKKALICGAGGFPSYSAEALNLGDGPLTSSGCIFDEVYQLAADMGSVLYPL